MFQHYLLLSFRTFKRFKGSFSINLIGLSIGLACTLLIYLWVNDELSMDKFHEKEERLYQVMRNLPLGDGGIETTEKTQGYLAKTLAEDLPEIERSVSIIPASWFSNQGILSLGDTYLKADGQYVGKDFFNLFSYKVLQGDKEKVLADNSSVMLSDELALKLFHTTENVIGKTVKWELGPLTGSYIISGIFEKPSRHSSAQFDLLFTYDLFFEKMKPIFDLSNWGNGSPSTYVLLKEGINVGELDEKIKNFSKAKFEALYGIHDTKGIGTLFLQRYADQYLYNRYENGVVAGGRIAYVKLFSIIALFILLIACINFMNLSTARASRRLKEIGVKKAMGASRQALIFQFLSESLLLTFISAGLALALVVLLLPEFNNITGKQLSLDLEIKSLLSVLAITLVTGLLAGSYPALYLSRFSPITVLKGKLKASVGETFIRKGLVVFQFSISVILIVSVLVIYKQIEFIQTKNLGYNKDNILSFKNEGRLNESLETFLQEVKTIPGVVNATSFAHNLTGGSGSASGIHWEGKNTDENILFGALEVDYGLLEMLDIKMLEGRTFSKKFGSEDASILFNEAAIKAMGLKVPVGKTIKLWGKDYQIVGVTQNFHFQSLYENVKPCFIRLNPSGGNVLVKIKAGKEIEAIEQIGKFYQEYNAGLTFDYKFLDEDYQALYAAENRVAILSRYFAGVAIVISCLGLLGLAAFTAERRRKEIGIRKVLGSDDFGIVRLLSREFMQMVFAAILIALPVSYLIAKNWLNDFAFAIELQWWFFAAAGLAALLIAGLTVATQTLRAARINPIKTLRDE